MHCGFLRRHPSIRDKAASMHRVVARIFCALHREDILDVLERVGHAFDRRVPYSACASLVHSLGLHEQPKPHGLVGGIARLAESACCLAQDLFGPSLSALIHRAHVPVAGGPFLQARRMTGVMRCFREPPTAEPHAGDESSH